MPAASCRRTATLAAAALVASGVATLTLATGASAAGVTPDCSAATTCSVTFDYTGAAQTFTVPDGVASVQATMFGASGVPAGGPSGKGGETVGTFPVAAGDALTVIVGQSGQIGRTAETFGGGGGVSASSRASSGGGGSFLFDNAGSLVLAAGGGGGASAFIGGGEGGDGGGAVGGSGGYDHDDFYTNISAAGGSQLAGGGGGSFGYNGGPKGTQGTAGTGPTTAPDSIGRGGTGGTLAGYESYGGGGGGGGYYGGGGGGSFAQGGGGGSAFASAAATGVQLTAGIRSGDGGVVITWPKKATQTTLSADPESDATANTDVTLTATVTGVGTPSGTVSFKDGSTVITGCDSAPVDVTGAATCTTSFEAGSHSLSATYSGDAGYAGSTGSLSYSVVSPLKITTSSLPGATYDTAYSQTLTVTGGAAPYTFKITGGTLPKWAYLSSAGGTLSGTPDVVGSATFTVQVTDDENRTDTNQYTLTVGKAPQSVWITSDAPAHATVGQTYDLTAAGLRGGDYVIFTGNDIAYAGTDGICTVDGHTVTFAHIGSCTVTANQAGNDDYTAGSASQTITVGPADQTVSITSAAPTGATVGQTYDVTATGGGSGNDITLTGTDGICTADGHTVTFVASGTCTITASQEGNADYNAAPQTTQDVAVGRVKSGVTMSESVASPVVGQPFTVTATVTADRGKPAGSVQFSVDGTNVGSPVTVTNGRATSPTLAPAVGDRVVGAHFVPTNDVTYTSADTSSTVVVAPAATTTALAVRASSIAAHVTANAPGSGTPAGSVTFYVDGTSVGSADLVHGSATLPHTVPTGRSHAVTARYAGNASYLASSASTARTNPSLHAAVTSTSARTKYGWYSAPVTVRFTCAAHGAALTAPCPAPVTISQSRAAVTVSRTVVAQDGGTATASVTVSVDRVKPTMTVHGVRNGHEYFASAPAVSCTGHDTLSGVASCRVTRSKPSHSGKVTYRATVTDKAGNVRTVRGSYTVTTLTIAGAKHTKGTYIVHRGRTYVIRVVGGPRPRLVYAAPYPYAPKGLANPFRPAGRAAGHGVWALAVTMPSNTKRYTNWNLGVQIGHSVHRIKIHVIR